MLDPKQRFSQRVENYVKYRPGYPAALIQLLVAECDLTPQSIIADIGSGTGLLARLFLANGNPVFGVEPNPEMRDAGEAFLRTYPHFTSIAASAEATTLPAASVDFITAGQAFHWFESQAALAEFKRILRPHGWVVLVWNERQAGGDDTPFLVAYEQLLQTYGTDYINVDHRRFGPDELSRLFGAEPRRATFANRQDFDFEGVKGRLLSSSYAPLPGHPHFAPMLAELGAIFDAYQQEGQVAFLYTTEVYLWPSGARAPMNRAPSLHGLP
jgi:SAM-dependent methyltransferase